MYIQIFWEREEFENLQCHRGEKEILSRDISLWYTKLLKESQFGIVQYKYHDWTE